MNYDKIDIHAAYGLQANTIHHMKPPLIMIQCTWSGYSQHHIATGYVVSRHYTCICRLAVIHFESIWYCIQPFSKNCINSTCQNSSRFETLCKPHILQFWSLHNCLHGHTFPMSVSPIPVPLLVWALAHSA